VGLANFHPFVHDTKGWHENVPLEHLTLKFFVNYIKIKDLSNPKYKKINAKDTFSHTSFCVVVKLRKMSETQKNSEYNNLRGD